MARKQETPRSNPDISDRELFSAVFGSKCSILIFLEILRGVNFYREILFSEPVQIYRYLNERNCRLPIFLQRNCSYMSGRCTRTSKKRSSFKVDQMLSNLDKSDKKVEFPGSYLTIGFISYTDSSLSTSFDNRYMQVEVFLSKEYRKKRKSGEFHDLKSVGVAQVMVNANKIDIPRKLPAISVRADQLHDNLETFKIVFHLENHNARLADGMTNIPFIPTS